MLVYPAFHKQVRQAYAKIGIVKHATQRLSGSEDTARRAVWGGCDPDATSAANPLPFSRNTACHLFNPISLYRQYIAASISAITIKNMTI